MRYKKKKAYASIISQIYLGKQFVVFSVHVYELINLSD